MKKLNLKKLSQPLYDKRGRKYKIYDSNTKTLKSLYDYPDEDKKDKEKYLYEIIDNEL